VLPLAGAEDAAAATTAPGNKPRRAVLLPPPRTGGSDDDENDDDVDGVQGLGKGLDSAPSSSADEDDYAEDTAKLVRLRRHVAALRSCRMITVWPADDDDRVSGR
jgi:hypothetical protein